MKDPIFPSWYSNKVVLIPSIVGYTKETSVDGTVVTILTQGDTKFIFRFTDDDDDNAEKFLERLYEAILDFYKPEKYVVTAESKRFYK